MTDNTDDPYLFLHNVQTWLAFISNEEYRKSSLIQQLRSDPHNGAEMLANLQSMLESIHDEAFPRVTVALNYHKRKNGKIFFTSKQPYSIKIMGAPRMLEDTRIACKDFGAFNAQIDKISNGQYTLYMYNNNVNAKKNKPEGQILVVYNHPQTNTQIFESVIRFNLVAQSTLNGWKNSVKAEKKACQLMSEELPISFKLPEQPQIHNLPPQPPNEHHYNVNNNNNNNIDINDIIDTNETNFVTAHTATDIDLSP